MDDSVLNRRHGGAVTVEGTNVEAKPAVGSRGRQAGWSVRAVDATSQLWTG